MTVRISATERAQESTAAQMIHTATCLSDTERQAVELREFVGSSCATISARLTRLELLRGDSLAEARARSADASPSMPQQQEPPQQRHRAAQAPPAWDPHPSS